MKTVEHWKRISIGRFVQLINGFAFPSEGFTGGEGMPLIRIRDLNGQNTEVNYHGRYSERYVVRRGDLLIGMDGDFVTVRWKGNNALLNQRVCKLVTKDSDFLDQRVPLLPCRRGNQQNSSDYRGNDR
jgi:type I restriction enzyme, S subunit